MLKLSLLIVGLLFSMTNFSYAAENTAINSQITDSSIQKSTPPEKQDVPPVVKSSTAHQTDVSEQK